VPCSTEFDPDIVLDQAVELFWERGYEATSVADLVEHLGISKASLYNTFGSKHQLYLKALDRYIVKEDPFPMSFLNREGKALPLVWGLVERFAEQASWRTLRYGCFLVNAAVERLPGDKEVERRVEMAWNGLEAALALCLHRAQAQGELSPRKDPLTLASFLLVFLVGLRVMAKINAPPSRYMGAAREALTLLQ